jgi:hypothetical protein
VSKFHRSASSKGAGDWLAVLARLPVSGAPGTRVDGNAALGVAVEPRPGPKTFSRRWHLMAAPGVDAADRLSGSGLDYTVGGTLQVLSQFWYWVIVAITLAWVRNRSLTH